MKFGIAIPTDSDSWRLVRRAEELGFHHAWFYDTQMLSADCFVAMAACAMKTTRIRLGTGVLIPSNRIAPVAANAFASLNKLAPGRIDFGISTGFTGRRAMGMGAVKLADMAEYIRVVQALWRGETVETFIEGQQRLIGFLNPELGLTNVTDPMPLYIAASGPRARAMTARLGGGWIDGAASVDRATAALSVMRDAWAAAGQASGALNAVAWAGGAVLADGEPADSPRAIAQAGPRTMTLLHRAADAALGGYPDPGLPGIFADAVAGYVEHARSFRPQGAHYLQNHKGHLMFVRPDERPFLSADLIRHATWTATLPELIARVGALKDAGFGQIVFSILPGQEHAVEDWGRVRAAFD
ncbi:MAG: LLM class flavin-dependent oxidoreductase [Rhodospirillales bacterium]